MEEREREVEGAAKVVLLSFDRNREFAARLVDHPWV